MLHNCDPPSIRIHVIIKKKKEKIYAERKKDDETGSIRRDRNFKREKFENKISLGDMEAGENVNTVG